MINSSFSLVVATISILLATAAAGAELRFSASSAWPEPYGLFNDDALVGGLVFDIGNALAEELGMTARWVVLPRKRIDIAVADGQIDVRCYTMPQWVHDPASYRFSPSLFSIDNLIIGRTGVARLSSAGDLAGKPVGSVLGFVYPILEPLALRGKLLRDDAITQQQVYQKLTIGRTNYALGDALSLAYFLRKHPGYPFAEWRLKFDQVEFQCAVPKHAKVDAALVMQSLQHLKTSQRIEKIVARYR